MTYNGFLHRNPDLLETTLDNEVVLMSIERGSYFGLEGTAKLIWQMLEQPMTKDQIVQPLCKQFDAERDVIDRDVGLFIQKMLDNGVLFLS